MIDLSLFEAAPTPLMMVDRDLRYVAANQSYCNTLDTNVESLLGRPLFEVFPAPAEQQAIVDAALHSALAGTARSVTAIPYVIDGIERWWTASHVPVRDRAGAIVGVMQHTQEVTSEVLAHRMRETVSQEFDHRVRNILAKITAIARRTARDAATLPEFLADFEPRIAAMGRAHDLLVRGGWERLGLAELVSGELAPYCGADDPRIDVSGDNVALPSRVAQAMGLALHELTTNAIKYGALATVDGRLAVRWDRAGSETLDFSWIETGLANLPPPRRSGFGSAIIDRILPAETGGIVSRTVTPTGLHCRVQLPVPMGW